MMHNRQVMRVSVFAVIGLLGLVLYWTMDEADAMSGLSPAEQRQMVRRLLHAGEAERAEQLARRIWHSEDQTPSAACLLAEVLIAQNRAPEAISLLQPILPLDRRGDVSEMMGRALIADGQLDRGRLELESALRMEPSRTTAVAALIGSFLNEQRFDDAARLLAAHAEEPALQALRMELAIAQVDVTVLSRCLEPVDAATVGCVLAMRAADDEWVTRLVRPQEKSPRGELVRAWLRRPNAAAAEALISIVLDRVEEPLTPSRPRAGSKDDAARLLSVAVRRWPGEPAWDALQPQLSAIVNELTPASASASH